MQITQEYPLDHKLCVSKMLKKQQNCENNNWVYGFYPGFYVLQVIILCLYFSQNIFAHTYIQIRAGMSILSLLTH